VEQPAGLRAHWFDGRSSRAQPVLVHLVPSPRGPGLTITPEDAPAPVLALANAEVDWPEAFSSRRMPRKLAVDLRAHGSLEIDDPAAWHVALGAAGHRAPLAQRMQTRWTVFVGVLLVAGLALAAFYRWGTPWAATQITRQVPLSWETELTQRAMRDIDGGLLKPSKLPPARQAQLRERFDALTRQVTPELQRYAGYAPQYTLHFRSGPMGPNAFALPGGTIVMTDDMVLEAGRLQLPDDALVGVLAHEIGHVVHRHTTRMVVEQGVLNIGLGLALGDVSSLVSFGTSLLTGLAYRRNHETEADCFAVAVLRRAKVPAAPMADLLLAIEAGDPQDATRKPRKDEDSAFWSFLSSHPATPERAQALKAGNAEACR
jgi:Zn-dependent protease with chaperone function